jgi:predicted type IV restriction endonuclease
MKEDLLDIRAGIKAGRYVNEATVSQGIVQRLLHSLGWPVYDPEVVAPEYSLGTRRVDYALCHPPRDPVILVEVKQVGQSKGADRQLFEYAFHKGVPMAILTDGQEWNFFLPTEQGDYGERQVYKLDILERDPAEIESSLKRYLEYKAVRSGQAIEAARRDYRNAARKRRAQRTLPDAWDRLVESEDELLIELLSDKVEDLCGVKPEPMPSRLSYAGKLHPGARRLPWLPRKDRSGPLSLPPAATFRNPWATRLRGGGVLRGALVRY